MSESTGPFRILFVCSGNTCRSPLAEALARARLVERGWSAVEVASAGTGAYAGSLASEGSLAVGASVGLDLSEHRSQLLTPELVDASDLILTMGPHHLYAVLERGGDGKSATLAGFAQGREDGIGPGVPDPFGGSLDIYRETLVTLQEFVTAALDRLAPVLDPGPDS